MKVLCGRPHTVLKSNAIKKSTYLRFAEKLNGRCAMQGPLWGAGSVLRDLNGTGNHQFDALYFTVVTGAVALGTAITFDKDDHVTKLKALDFFTPEAELDNGRLAMLGMGAYLGYKALDTFM